MKEMVIKNIKKQMSIVIDELELNEKNHKKFSSIPDPMGIREKSYKMIIENLEDEYMKLQEELFKLMRD